jgi:integrase|tara:strand:+ start:1416 stop:4514 length:3099 start_codon:yes stop_codon:yes gene_type:complete
MACDVSDDVQLFLQGLGLPADDLRLQRVVQWLGKNPALKLSQILLFGAAVGRNEHAPVKEAESKILGLKLSNHDLYDWLIALIRIIDAGNALGRWSLCLPRQPYKNKPQISPYHPRQSGIPAWMRAVDQRLVEPWPLPMTDRQWIGALIAVVTLRGGIHSTASLRALLGSIDEPTYIAEGVEHWRDLSIAFRDQPDAERRRWYPEPLSEMLLTAKDWSQMPLWQKLQEDKWPIGELWQCLRDALLIFPTGGPRPVKSMSAWLKAVGYYWQLQLPPVIQSVAAGSQISHAVTPSCWGRLIGHVAAPSTVDQHRDEDGQVSDETMPDEEVVGPIENLWMTKLTRACRTETTAEARRALKALEPLWPKDGSAQQLIPEWADYLLQVGGATGQALAPATAVKYLSLAGRRLANSVGSEPLFDLGLEGLSELYEEILRGAKSLGHRKYLAKTLRAWHQFLVVRYGMGEIDEAEVLGLGMLRTPVDAVVLTLDEFLSVRRALIEDVYLLQHGEHAIDVAWMMLTLGFRCGLRRREALGLRVRDIHWSAKPELLIRPYSGRRLKSASASRRIPLYALMDDEELAVLRRLVDRRVAMAGTEALLMDIDREGQALGQSVLIPRLHALMRQVTGGAEIRFHHLRHSFATWNLLRLLTAQRPFDAGRYLPGHPLTARWLVESSKTFRSSLLGEHGGPTRKAAYAVARLMGHSAVTVTMEHYFHVADWLIAETSRSLPTPLTFRAARELVPAATSSVYRNVEDLSLDGLLRYLRDRNRRSGRLVMLKPPARPRGRPKKEVQLAELSDANHHGQLYKSWWAFLYRVSRLGIPDDISQLCRAHDIGEREGRALIAAAASLTEMEHHRGHRHVAAKHDDIRGLVPNWPHRLRAQRLLMQAASRIGPLIDQKGAEFAGQTIHEVLEVWAARAWRTRTWLYLPQRELEAGRGYIQLILAVLDDKHLEIVAHARVTDRLRRKVNAELRLPQRRRIEYRVPTDATSPENHRAIQIRVVHPEIDDVRDRTVRSWRLLMFVASVHSRMFRLGS